MNIKIKAFELYSSGWSYGQIAKELGIGKTTAYDYVKEVRISGKKVSHKPIPTGSEPVPNYHSEPEMTTEKVGQEDEEIKTTRVVKEFTGDQLIEKKFDSLEFDGKFLELIGKPSKLFSAIIWGLPKGGKSNFSIRLADYLQEYFGDVVYVAAEEGESVTLQEKIKAIGGSKVTFAEIKDRYCIKEYLYTKPCDFVFIDSINNAGIDNEFLEALKQENSGKSFISIVQATKGGNFKGDQALTHNCDFIIKVVQGVASHSGRFNTSTEINIFDEPLYKKNPDPRKKTITMSVPNNDSTKENLSDEKIETPIEPKNVVEPLMKSDQDLIDELFNSASKTDTVQITVPKQRKKQNNNIKSTSTDDSWLLWALGLTSAVIIYDNLNKKSKNNKK